MTTGVAGEFASFMSEMSQRREVGESRHHSTAAHAVSLLCPGRPGCPEAVQGLGWGVLILSRSVPPWGGSAYGPAPTGR